MKYYAKQKLKHSIFILSAEESSINEKSLLSIEFISHNYTLVHQIQLYRRTLNPIALH
jgi:hypothetical protein